MTKEWILRRAPWLLIALVLAVLLPGTATLPLVDRDEPRFATATREMMERHDWVVPTFNGRERFDKPVLTYWLMRVGYGIFGVGEFGARVHAIAATLALVLVTWWIGRRWFGEVVGLYAGAILASCLQVFIHGRLALADMPMVACVLIACAALKELLGSPPHPAFRTPAWWWLYGALGLGFLAKGPIVFAVPVLGLLIFRFILFRQPVSWSRLQILPGLMLTLVIMALWGIPALIVTEGRFWQVGMGEHVVQRGFERFNNRGYSPFFYLGTAPLSLFPWIGLVGFLPWIIRRNWDGRTAWLVSWIVATYLIFTAYATQLPHYVLPAFPALALLLGHIFVSDRTAWPRAAVRASWAFVGVVGLVLLSATALVLLVELPPDAEMLRGAFGGALLVLLGLLLGLAGVLVARIGAGVLALLLVGIGASWMGRSLHQTSLTAASATWVKDLPTGARCWGAGFSEPSLVFYTGRQWSFARNVDDLVEAMREPGPIIVATLVEETDPMNFFRAGLLQRFGSTKSARAHAGPSEFVEVLSSLTANDEWKSREVVGFNLGRTRWQKLRIWTRLDGAVAR